jgi:hypothetical protein
MTIRVVLTGRPDAALAQQPGRVLLVHADHSFADLAEAIDGAFGRWDLTPLHQFEVEGRMLLSAEASTDDPEAEASDEVTVGEVGLRTGARFTYVFDLGEQWSHESLVEEVGVDPFEAAGEEPDVPVPVYGWGTVPDQYGRVTEDDENEGTPDAPEASSVWADREEGFDEDFEDELEDWAADESASWAVVRAALAGVQRDLDEAALSAAATRLREQSADPLTADVAALWAASSLDADDPPRDDLDLWMSLAAGVVSPRQDVGLPDDALAAWGALEPADWAGAVIEMVRAGPGVQVTPAEALEMIARCPEVEEDDLTDEGERVLLEGLGVAVMLWKALGVLDTDGRLTPLGAWGLPESLQRAWDGESG